MASNEIDCKSPNLAKLLAAEVENGNQGLAQEAFGRCSMRLAIDQSNQMMENQPIKPVIPGVGNLAAAMEIAPSIRANLYADMVEQLRKDGYDGKIGFQPN